MPAWAIQLELRLQQSIREVSARVDHLYNRTVELRRRSAEPAESRQPHAEASPPPAAAGLGAAHSLAEPAYGPMRATRPDQASGTLFALECVARLSSLYMQSRAALCSPKSGTWPVTWWGADRRPSDGRRERQVSGKVRSAASRGGGRG